VIMSEAGGRLLACLGDLHWCQICPAVGHSERPEVDVARVSAVLSQEGVRCAAVTMAHDQCIGRRGIGEELKGCGEAEHLVIRMPLGQAQSALRGAAAHISEPLAFLGGPATIPRRAAGGLRSDDGRRHWLPASPAG